MKKTIVLSLLFALLLFNCKKKTDDPIPSDNSPTCFSTNFERIYEEPLSEIDIQYDSNGYIYVFGKYYSKSKILKFTNKGQLIWSKEYPEIPGDPKEFLVLVDDCPLILTREPNVIESFTFHLSGYIQDGQYFGFNECKPYFDFTDSVTTTTVTGKCYLTKLDTSGAFLWTKEISDPYDRGKKLQNAKDSSFLFLTTTIYGRQPVLVYDQYGIYKDTVLFPMNKNKINIYSIDLNGNINWKKTTEDVFIIGYEGSVDPINIALTDNKIVVNTQNEIFVHNLNGDYEKRFYLIPEHCNNSIESLYAAGDNYLIVTGSYYERIDVMTMTFFYYTKRINVNGNEFWHKDEKLSVRDISRSRFLVSDYENVSIYDFSGNIRLTCNISNAWVSRLNCQNGIVSADCFLTSFTLKSTDSNGNY